MPESPLDTLNCGQGSTWTDNGFERYIGTKIVLALPEPKDGQLGYAVVYEDGYRSWSPKETFERAYRRITEAEIGLIEHPEREGK